MTRLLKKLLLALPGFQWLCRRLTRHHVRVFMYHRFVDSPRRGVDGHGIETLDWQMAAVKAHHEPWTVQRHFEALSGTRPGNGGCPVVVTVDDGYRDFASTALPVFEKYGIPVTLYVTTGFVSGDLWLWWDQLRYMFETAPETSLDVEYAGEHFHVDLNSPTSRRATWHRIAGRCCFLQDDDRLAVIATIARRLDFEIPEQPPEQFAPLSWDELRRLRDRGVAFGAHTVSHSVLTRLPLVKARWEIQESRRMLEEKLGEPASWFCFPLGGPADWSSELVDEVAAAGFATSYLAFPSLSGDTNLFTLPRWGAPCDPTEFHWILCGAAYLDLYLHRLLGRKIGPGPSYWEGARPASLAHEHQSAPQEMIPDNQR